MTKSGERMISSNVSHQVISPSRMTITATGIATIRNAISIPRKNDVFMFDVLVVDFDSDVVCR